MKSKAIVALVLFALSALAVTTNGCRMRSRSTQAEPKASEATKPAEPQAELSITATEDKDDLPQKEEIRRKFKLAAESSISVNNINGSVTVQTADTDTAEVLIVRSAKTQEDLQNYRKVKIEESGNKLRIGIENDRKSLFSALGKIPEGRQRVIVKIPRQVNYNSYNVSGDITLGEIRGRVGLHEINGQIKAERIAGPTEIGNVNGNIEATFAQLDGKGVEVFDVNGNIELRFEGTVNADLSAWSITGQLNPELPDVQTRDEEQSRGRLKARIGTGGTQIRVSGINGNVNLLKADKAPATAAKVASK